MSRRSLAHPLMAGGMPSAHTGSVRPPIGFALEAKCYAAGNGVGVKELSRLIWRLRHREFGILVTTSFLGRQAYEELRSDRHPVIVIAGADIAAILLHTPGLSTPDAVTVWLRTSFPKASEDD